MTDQELLTLIHGDQELYKIITCPPEQYVGNPAPDVRERRAFYGLTRYKASRLEIVDALESFMAGNPYQRASNKTAHLNELFQKATAKGLYGPPLTKATPRSLGKEIKRPKLTIQFGK